MDELLNILKEIRDGIHSMDSKMQSLKETIDDIRGDGFYGSLTDIYFKLEDINDDLEEIKGDGERNSISNVYDILESTSSVIDSIDFVVNIMNERVED